jgi:hypothetical protein
VVRSVENSYGVLILGDTIQGKAWTSENELMCEMIEICIHNELKFRFVPMER